eukprot:COSAG02_NODE_6187_length_3744_cov_2.283402_4_plen_186_part_00
MLPSSEREERQLTDKSTAAARMPSSSSTTVTAKSLTDWLCSALLGRPWQFLTGVDLLPPAGVLFEDSVTIDPEAGDAECEGLAAPPALYSADGQHGMSGYHVKTVGNAPVGVPQPLTPAERSRAEASAGVTTGSAWNTVGGTWETRDTTAWATTRLPELCCANGQSAIAQLEVSAGDASVAVVRG